MTTLKPAHTQMSNAMERRIINGIPFFVPRGTAKDGPADLSTWSPDPKPIGHFDGTNLTINISDDANAALAAWRTNQVPRPRAQLRVGR